MSMSVAELITELGWRIRGCEQRCEEYRKELSGLSPYDEERFGVEGKICGQQRELDFYLSIKAALMRRV